MNKLTTSLMVSLTLLGGTVHAADQEYGETSYFYVEGLPKTDKSLPDICIIEPSLDSQNDIYFEQDTIQFPSYVFNGQVYTNRWKTNFGGIRGPMNVSPYDENLRNNPIEITGIGVVFSDGRSPYKSRFNGTCVTNVVLNGVRAMNNGAFASMTGLKALSANGKMRVIGSLILNNSPNCHVVRIESESLKIATDAFKGSSVTTFELPNITMSSVRSMTGFPFGLPSGASIVCTDGTISIN